MRLSSSRGFETRPCVSLFDSPFRTVLVSSISKVKIQASERQRLASETVALVRTAMRKAHDEYMSQYGKALNVWLTLTLKEVHKI